MNNLPSIYSPLSKVTRGKSEAKKYSPPKWRAPGNIAEIEFLPLIEYLKILRISGNGAEWSPTRSTILQMINNSE